ncbi:GNAT family N-acetyltransferase [Paenibacillus aestuarii]|uniref:GNAT family N-acetyltransferase n=1 Tax=Paenibacillus aestuarii TaxID=516965 RepID=A0ABW0KHW3_9BACL|nr:GNAT family N-acetyltransferase [Paenibacillus aestuarii]
MNLRTLHESDCYEIRSVVNEWWGGRQMTHLLPRLFFEHFQNTSFVMMSGSKIVGFVIGFISPSKENEAYIHFVGVHPDFRKQGVAHRLYNKFFEEVRERGCDTIRCITSPVNVKSIDFHHRMGFTADYAPDYEGPDEDRILFVRYLNL